MLLALIAAYTFHVQVTDARTALYANPQFEELKLSQEQLERAAHDRVMLLDHTTGAHFVWLMMSWKPDVEQTLNDGAPGAPDVGLTPKSETTLSIRCLREECRVGKVMLKNGEATEVPFDSDVRVEIPKR